MDSLAPHHVEMLAQQIAALRRRLERATVHARWQLAHAHRRAIWALVEYVHCPDPDHEKERRAVNRAVQQASYSNQVPRAREAAR